MSEQTPTSRPESDERWRHLLVDPFPHRRTRRFHQRIPSSPRCKLCLAPFGGVGGLVMSLVGHRRWPKNPKYCAGCFRMLRDNRGGAEIECTLFFADVRGSTPLAERMRPAEFSRLMGRFYDTAFEILVDHDAFVDKFVGDEVVGIFVPALAGDAHGARAIRAAHALLRATGHDRAAGPWVPVGVGIGTGTAYVGSIGEGPDTELTAMGDVVNTTARLSSAAASGEILVSAATASAADLPRNLERRSLQLKGKSDPTNVVVLTLASSTAATGGPG